MPDALPAAFVGQTSGAPAVRRILCVVVNFNRRDAVLRCLDRLVRRVAVPPGNTLDLLVVDNASVDGSREAISERYPAVEVVNTGGNLGGSGAFRAGLRCAVDGGYDLVWLHDNDAVSSRRVLFHYVAALAALGGGAIVGGSMHQLESPRRLNEAGGYFCREGSLDIQLQLMGQPSTPSFRGDERPSPVDYVSFANLLMPVEVVRRIGLPDDFFLHFDDVEFCLRARAAGYPVAAVPAAVFWHESALAKPTTWIQYYDTRNMLTTIARWRRGRLRFRRLAFLLSAARHLVSRRPALTRAILDGVRDQARGVTGRVAVDASRFEARDVAAGGIEPLLAANGCRHLALDYDSLMRLPRAYRAPWLRRLAAQGGSAFLCRLDRGRFTLHEVTRFDPADITHPIELPPPLARVEARRIAADTLLVRAMSITGPRTLFALRAFRRVLWLAGSHVVDHDARGNGRERAGLLGRWLWSWVYLAS